MNKLFQWLLSMLTGSKSAPVPEVSVTVDLSSGYNKPAGTDSTIRKTDVQLTEHFSLFSLTVTEHTELQEANRDLTDQQIQKLTLVAELLETIRGIINLPIIPDDSYRCPKLNTIDHGVADSQHALCEAADWCPEGITTIDKLYPIFKIIWDAIKAKKLRVGQIIFEESTEIKGNAWIHVSLPEPFRPTEKCNEIMIMRDNSYELLEQVKP